MCFPGSSRRIIEILVDSINDYKIAKLMWIKHRNGIQKTYLGEQFGVAKEKGSERSMQWCYRYF